MELLRRTFWAAAALGLGLVILLPGSSCRKRLPLPDAPGDRRGWLMAGGGPDHRGFSSERLTPPLELRWVARARGPLAASPIVTGDLVCVGTLGRRFYFFSAADGQRHAAMKTDGGISAAAAAGENCVYVATEAGEGKVYALDLSKGEVLWKTAVGDVSAALTYHQGSILVSTNLGRIYCLEAGDGSFRWQFSTHGMRITAAAVSGTTAVCGCDDGYVYALGLEDGAECWSRRLEGAVWSTPVVGDDRIYTGTFGGQLYCLTAGDGQTVWRRELEGGITRPMALGMGMVFAGTDRGLLGAVDQDSGELRWAYRLKDARPGAPLATSDALFVGGSDGQVRALSTAEGKLLWQHQAEGAIISAPVLYQGRLYVGSMEDYLYAFAATGSKTAASAPAGIRPADDNGSFSRGRIDPGSP